MLSLYRRKVKYDVFFDLSLTYVVRKDWEIIEFPTIVLDTSSLEVVEEPFHWYVRPRFHEKLNEVCKDITGNKNCVVHHKVNPCFHKVHHVTKLPSSSRLMCLRKHAVIQSIENFSIQIAPNRVKVATDDNIFGDNTFLQELLENFLFSLR